MTAEGTGKGVAFGEAAVNRSMRCGKVLVQQFDRRFRCPWCAPRHRGVFFAFGHQHLGLTLCGVTARLVADLVVGHAPTIDMAP